MWGHPELLEPLPAVSPALPPRGCAGHSHSAVSTHTRAALSRRGLAPSTASLSPFRSVSLGAPGDDQSPPLGFAPAADPGPFPAPGAAPRSPHSGRAVLRAPCSRSDAVCEPVAHPDFPTGTEQKEALVRGGTGAGPAAGGAPSVKCCWKKSLQVLENASWAWSELQRLPRPDRTALLP